MTLGRAASLFETYNPPSGPAAVPTTPTVNAVYCKENDHILSDCPKKKPVSDKKRLKNPIRLHQLSPVQLSASGSLVPFAILWTTCLNCVLVVRK